MERVGVLGMQRVFDVPRSKQIETTAPFLWESRDVVSGCGQSGWSMRPRACVGGPLVSLRAFLFSQEEHWPLFLSLVVGPTFVQLLLLPWFPESPRYLLIEKHNVHATIEGEDLRPV